MSVKSYFESERRKKQITWTLIILGALFAGAMLSSYYSDDKKPAAAPQITSTTQISMVPSKADYEQHQAIYNDRLLNLERESKEAKQREAKLQSDKKRLEDRIALLERTLLRLIVRRMPHRLKTAGRLPRFSESSRSARRQALQAAISLKADILASSRMPRPLLRRLVLSSTISALLPVLLMFSERCRLKQNLKPCLICRAARLLKLAS